MTGLQTLAARAAVGAVGAIATLALARWRRPYELSPARFDRLYLLSFALVRLALFAAIFLMLRLPVRGDVGGYYLQEMLAAQRGGLPYRDFASSYAPLTAYINLGLYRAWPSVLSLILFAIVAEIGAAAVWLRVLRHTTADRTVRLTALLCILNPISLQFVTVDGQNNVLISLLVALALLAMLQHRRALSGAWLATSIAAVKFLPLLFVPPFLLYLRRGWLRWLAGFSAIIIAVYGFFQWVLHAPVLHALDREGALKSAGGFPYLIEAFSGVDFGLRLWDGLLLTLLLLLIARSARLARGVAEPVAAVRGSMASMCSLLLTLMAFSKKTWPTYAVIILFPLALAVARRVTALPRRPARLTVALFCLFSLLAVTAHSVWASVLNQAPAGLLHAELVAHKAAAWLFLGAELLLFACYMWLVSVCMAEERQPPSAPSGLPATGAVR